MKRVMWFVIVFVAMAGLSAMTFGQENAQKSTDDAKTNPAVTTDQAVTAQASPPVDEKQPQPVEQPPAAAAQPEKPAEPDPQKVVVTVNDTPITEAQVEERFQQAIRKEKIDPGPFYQNIIDQKRQAGRRRNVDILIKSTLLQQAARNEGVELTDKDLEAKNEQIIQIAMKRHHWTREQLEADFIKSRGYSMTESLQELNKDLLFRDSILSEKLYSKKYPEPITVTDEEVRLFYDRNKASTYDKPEMVRASHILIKLDANTTADQKKQAKEKIESLLKQVNEPGADFSEMAKANSQCNSAKNGGDLGFFPRTGMMVEPFAAAAFALQPGQISPIVESQFGYHIIKVTARKEAVHIPFDDVKDEIRDNLIDSKRIRKINEFVAGLVAQAKIVYTDENDKPRSPATPATKN